MTLFGIFSITCFVIQLLLQEFEAEEVPAERQDPEFNSPDIHILRLRLKHG